jgi:hypothetical protein
MFSQRNRNHRVGAAAPISTSTLIIVLASTLITATIGLAVGLGIYYGTSNHNVSTTCNYTPSSCGTNTTCTNIAACNCAFGTSSGCNNSACAQYPVQKPGWVPFSIINASKNPSITFSNTYVVAKGIDPSTGLPAFVSFDTNGVGNCVDASANTVPSLYTYPLSYFPTMNGIPFMYMPGIISARLYFSLNYKLVLPVVQNVNGIFTIVDPSSTVTNLISNPSYNQLYDKIEFDIQSNQCVINPTLVDYFSLPLPITVSSSSGCNNLYAGMPPSQNRELIFSSYLASVSSNVADTNAQIQWNNLALTSSGKNLRILSTNTAMSAAPPIFDPTYLFNASYGLNWLGHVWFGYYQTNSLWMDLSQVAGYGLYSGIVSGGNFVFTKQTGALGSTVTVFFPNNSVPFFAGTGFTISGDPIAAPIIQKYLSAGVESGIFPSPTSASNPVNNTYFQSQKSLYYHNSAFLTPANDGTWYDFYSKVLHSFAVSPYDYYTYAYDDVLGSDNTITSPNLLSNPIQITVTLGNLINTVIT